MSACLEPGCLEPTLKGKRRCAWHWLALQSIDVQERAAVARLARSEGLPVRRKVPESLWPPGGRWCSGCQSFVPNFYTTGSRCRACARRASRASHVGRTYAVSGDEVAELKRWQGGRCFICGRRTVTRELAVDHDHESGVVRGLLCSDENHGCNVLLRRVLGDLEAARRLVAYVEMAPLERMRKGQAPWVFTEPVPSLGPPPF